MSLVKGRDLSLTGTHVIRNGLFLIDKWDPAKEETKQLHEINIENKMECMKRIANIANLSLDMSELTRREKITTTLISKYDQSWDAHFTMLVEYVDENFKVDQQQSTVKHNWDGGTVTNVKKIYPCLGSSHSGYEGDKINLVKIRVKKMISELKLIA